MAALLDANLGQQSRLLSTKIIQGVKNLNLREKILISFKFCRSERSDFKREPCKVVSILDGWTVELTDNSSQTNTFQLMNGSVGTVYKFRCSSHELTIAWLKALQKITRPPLPTNLMTFE